MNTISIEEVSFKHLKELVILFDLYRQFYKQKSDIASAQKFLKERTKKKDSIIYIALIENIVVGFTQLYPLWSSVQMQKLWLLNDLYVLKLYRNQGIANLLLNKAKELAQKTSSKGLFLKTQKDNIKANNLYQKNGWTQDKIFLTYEYTL